MLATHRSLSPLMNLAFVRFRHWLDVKVVGVRSQLILLTTVHIVA